MVLVAACGSTPAAPDAMTDARTDAMIDAACTARWSGNLTEVATAAAPCSTRDGTHFTARVPTTRLDAPLAIDLDLGTTATTGSFASATVPAWSALGTRAVDARTCTYTGGSEAAPHGDFTLDLTARTLVLDLAVLADPFTACGDPTTAHVSLAF